ncbi:MAG: DUF3179 domain-containing protein [Bacteroidota bacterium]
MKYATVLLPLLTFLLLSQTACQKSDDFGSGDWLLPRDMVRDGGPGRDGIPSIDRPNFAAVNTGVMDDEENVLVVKVGDEVRVYPHLILDWHEIVNDRVGEEYIAITYCPLTGTGIGWNREVNGTVSTFGVSGLLFNSNLLPFDRETNSIWSQMRLDCVNGTHIESVIETYPIIEMSWKTCKALFPDGQLMTTVTGHNRDYGRYPYGNYKTSSSFVSTVTPLDNRLHPKERVLGVIIDGKAKTYRFNNFPSAASATLQDDFQGEPLVIFGSEPQNYMVAYKRQLSDGTLLNFLPSRDATDPEVAAIDEGGTRWNIFGEAIAGPRAGTQLEATVNYIGYWFSWGAFYTVPELHR